MPDYALISVLCGGAAGVVLHMLSQWWCAGWRTDPPAFCSKQFRVNIATSKLQLCLSIIFTISIFGLSLYHFGYSLAGWTAILFGFFLVVMTFVDLEHFILPDRLTKPLIALGLGQGALGIHTDLQAAAIGAVAGYGSLWLVNTLFRIIRKKHGMGGGDFKLFAAIGAWQGWEALPVVIIIAAVSGIVFAIIRAIILRDNLANPFPFGPTLAMGGFIGLFYGHEILHWYVSLLTV